MFDKKKDTDGNYICHLCSGTYVPPKEKERKVCKYTGEHITDDYASKKFWMPPIEYFYSKMEDIEAITRHSLISLKSNDSLRRQKFANVLYSQLVTALEVYLKEKFRQGMESPKAFNSFVSEHFWKTRYYPNEIYGNIKQIVNMEVNKINFLDFAETGRVYEAAFGVDIFGFPSSLKREVNKILRYRHSLIHQDEIWDKGRFIKIDFPQLLSDIAITKDFVSRIEDSFEKNIGVASEAKMERVRLEKITDEKKISTCEKCPLGMKFDSETIVCFEGAYDGIGFGMKTSEWRNPPCGGISFKEAMRQRKILGEQALFGQLSLIPVDEEKEKNASSKTTKKRRQKKKEER